MAERTVSVRLRAQVDQYQQAMRQASKSTSDFARDTDGSLQRLGGKMQDVGDSMTKKVTLPLVAAGAGAFKLSSDFDSAMSRIVGLVGVSTDEIGELRDGVLELSGDTAKAPQELADALFTITSAGFRGAAALDVLDAAAKASAAGMGETRAIAEALTGAVNAYGPEVLGAAEATDILVATARAGNFETSQLAGSLGRVTPFAKQANVAFSDVGGAVALLTRVNNDAAQSVTQISALFRAFVVPTAEAQTILGDLGMTAGDVREMLGERGLVETLGFLDDSLGGNREQLGRLIGSSEGAAAAFQILDADVATLEGTFGAVADSAGITEEAFAAVTDTADFKTRQALADLQAALIEIGTTLAPIVTSIASGVSSIAQSFSSLPSGAQTAIVAVAGVVAAIGPLLSVGGRLLTNIRAIRSGFIAMKAVMGASTLGALGGVGAAVGIAALAAWELGRAGRESAKRVDEMTQAMQDAGSAAEGFASWVAQAASESDITLQVLSEAGVTFDELAGAVSGTSDEFDTMKRRLIDAAREAGLAEWKVDGLAEGIDGLRREGADAAERLRLIEEATGDAGDAAADATPDMADLATQFGLTEEDAALLAGTLDESTGPALGRFGEILDDTGAAAVEWEERMVGALNGVLSGWATFSEEALADAATFREELALQILATAAWQDNLITIASQTSPEFATYLAEMGAAGATLVQDLATDGDELQATFEVWQDHVEVSNREIIREMREVSPQARAELQGMTETFRSFENEYKRSGELLGDAAGGGILERLRWNLSDARREANSYISWLEGRAASVSIPVGGTTSSGNPQRRAMGGPVRAGEPYLVGERGIEMFMPDTAGYVIPHHAIAGALSGASGGASSPVSVQIDVHPSPGMNEEHLADLVGRKLGWRLSLEGRR